MCGLPWPCLAFIGVGAELVKPPIRQLLLQLCSRALQHGLRLWLASGQAFWLAKSPPFIWPGTAAPELLSTWQPHQRAGKVSLKEQGP